MKSRRGGFLLMGLAVSLGVHALDAPDRVKIYGMDSHSVTQVRLSSDQLRSGAADVYIEGRNSLAVERLYQRLQLTQCRSIDSADPIDVRLVMDFYRGDKKVATLLANRAEIQEESTGHTCALSKDRAASLDDLLSTFMGRFE